MSDPRFTDPHYTDPRTDPRATDPTLNNPIVRRGQNVSGVWGWIVGLAVAALIAFVVIAGWNSDINTASDNAPPAVGTNSTPPTTTGSGATSPQPSPPAAPPANRAQ